MTKFPVNKFKKASLFKKLNAFLKIVAVTICLGSSLAYAGDADTNINSAVGNKDDLKFGCPAAYISDSSSGGQNLVAPFNSTICPKDDTVQIAYRFLPHVMEKAADVLNLRYKKEIDEYFNVSKFSGSHIGNFEIVVGVVRSIAIWFISIILGFQVFAAGVKSLTDGHIGGAAWGNFGVTTSFCLGIIFLLPIGNNMYVGELILAMMFLIGLGICNMGISTVLYTMGHGADQTHVLGGDGISGSLLAYNDRHTRDVSDGDSRTPAQIGQHAGVMHAVRYIESNMCLKQTAKIVGINYIKENDHWYVWHNSKIDGLLGLDPSPSYINDSHGTTVEIQKNGNSATISYGVNVDATSSGSKAGVGGGLCSSTTVAVPPLTLAENGKYKDIYTSSIADLLNKQVVSSSELLSKASTDKHQEKELSEKLTANLGLVNKDVIESIKKYGDSHSTKISGQETLDVLHNLSDYFYKKIIFDIQTGGSDNDSSNIASYSKHYYALVNGFSHEIDNGVAGGDCYADYYGYKTTKKTIAALNSGEMPSDKGFNLKCANVSNSGFTMSFKADTGSYAAYMRSITTTLKSEEQRDLIKNNYSKLSGYLGNIFGAMYISRKTNEDQVGESINKTFNNGSPKISQVAYAIINQIREGGFPRFGMEFLNLFSETESLFYTDRHSVVSMMPVYNTLYSANTGYVSSAVSSKSKVEYTPDKIIMPPAFYDVVSSSSYANSSDIQNAILSKIGSMDSGGDGGNTGNMGAGMSGAEGIQTLDDTATIAWQKAREVLISMVPVIAIPSSVLTTYSTSAIAGAEKMASANAIDSRYASPVDIKYSLEDLCRGGSSLNSGAGSNSFMSKHVCDRYNRHPLTYYQDMGVDLLQNVGVLALAYIGVSMAGTITNKKMKSLYNEQKALEKKIADNGSLDVIGESANAATKSAAKGKIVKAGAVMMDGISKAAKLLSGLFVYILMLLIIIGIVFGFVMPVLPYLVFSLAWLNFIMMFLQFMAVSMLLFSSLVLFSDNDRASMISRQGLVNAFTNLVFRPIACVIAFSVGWSFAYAALQAMDSVSVMIIGNFSDSMNFDDITSMNLLFGMFFMGIAQFSIMKWVFSTAMSLPNYIIKHMGGDTVDGGSHVLTSILGAKIVTLKMSAKTELAKSRGADGGRTDLKGNNVRDKLNSVSDWMTNKMGSTTDVGFTTAFNIYDKVRGVKNETNYDPNPLSSHDAKGKTADKGERDSSKNSRSDLHSDDGYSFTDHDTGDHENPAHSRTGTKESIQKDDHGDGEKYSSEEFHVQTNGNSIDSNRENIDSDKTIE